LRRGSCEMVELDTFRMSARTKHDRILQEGLALMSRDGLAGVTLGVLAAQAEMSKSGLFAHFRSKEDVQVELLKHAAQIGARYIVEPSMAADPGLPRLRSLVEHWLGWAPRAGLPGGCPVAAAIFEVDDASGLVREQVLRMESEWRALLTQSTAEAVERGHLHSDLDVEQFVWELSGIYLSHHVAQRFLRAPDADLRARRAFGDLLARSLPSP
jgi:AcrR family transcriptional regulator